VVDRPVNFIIDVEGGDDAARQFEDIKIQEQEAADTTRRLTAALGDLKKAEGDNTQAISRMRRELVRAQQAQKGLREEATAASVKSLDFAQKAQQLGSTIGQVGAVLSRVNPQLGRMGAAIGGVGAQIPALTGSLGPVAQAVAALTVAVDLGAAALDFFNPQVDETADGLGDMAIEAVEARTRIEELTAAIQESARVQGALSGLAGGEAITSEETRAQEQLRGATAARVSAERDIARLAGVAFSDTMLAEIRAAQSETSAGDAFFDAIGLGGRGQELREQIALFDEANIQIRERTQLVEGLAEAREISNEAERIAAEGSGRTTGAPPEAVAGGRTRSRGGGGDDGVEAAQRRADRALADGLQRQQRLREAAAREVERLKTQEQTGQIEALAAQREVERAIEEERFAAIRKRIDEEREAAELQLELLERAESEAREATARVKADAEGVLGPMLSGLTDALGNIIAGAETADEAFQGLLAGFLEMIAQRAALEAASEFAAAIGDFASQNYSSGALHLAAGAAWTVVAVAAGAGSVAAAPAQTAPVSPETGADAGEGGGGGTNVFNINGTIISAEGPGARARAGREIGGLFNEGARRFGRSG